VMSVEMGKILDESIAETALLQKKIDVTIEDGLELVRTRTLDIPGQGQSEIHFRPKGVLAIIGPFNFPVHLSNGHIIPALLTGNVVILKPSEKVPYSAQIYAEAAEAAGFPPGVFQLLQGNHETATRLLRHTGVHGVLATCSFDVGVKIQKELAHNPEKIVALEMGGKNAAVVLEDAPVEATAKALIQSSFLTTGQRCTALSRVYVAPGVIDALVKRVHELAKELVITQPFEEEPKPFMGPLVSSYSKENFLRYSALAESEGAEAVMRPKSLEGVSRLNRKPIPTGHYVTPSIHRLKSWNAKSSYQSHEIFGPDLFFCPVKDLDEAIAATNASKYGLVSSVFGGSREMFDYAADRIDCGLVYWNRATIGASGKLPFGGWKASGNHRPAGLFAIYQSTQAQARILGL
jgi:succinylglutamic semialdehyde dehydrogenase